MGWASKTRFMLKAAAHSSAWLIAGFGGLVLLLNTMPSRAEEDLLEPAGALPLLEADADADLEAPLAKQSHRLTPATVLPESGQPTKRTLHTEEKVESDSVTVKALPSMMLAAKNKAPFAAVPPSPVHSLEKEPHEATAGELPTSQDDSDVPAESPPLLGDTAADQANVDTSDAETWESYSDLPAVASVAEEITGGIRVEDIVEPPSDYRYAAFGRADPFLPPKLTTAAARQVEPLEIPIVSPLQRFSLGKLSVVGIWQLAAGERKAMVMTPGEQAQGIVVKTGDPIGDRGGKIIEIASESLMVREFLLAPDGTRQFQDEQLFMRAPPRKQIDGKIIFKPGSTTTMIQMDEPAGPLQDDAAILATDPHAAASGAQEFLSSEQAGGFVKAQVVEQEANGTTAPQPTPVATLAPSISPALTSPSPSASPPDKEQQP